MERGHLALENVDEPGHDQACYEWCEKRPEAASMKEPQSGLVSRIVGMRLTHADNHIMRLMITPVAMVADISFQVAAIASKLSPVLKRFALVTAANVTVYLTSVSSNLAPVGTNLP